MLNPILTIEKNITKVYTRSSSQPWNVCRNWFCNISQRCQSFNIGISISIMDFMWDSP